MSNIRVTYSGFINLFTGLARVAAAFIFITLVTRSLSVEEFGHYNLVLSIITYVITSHWIISYWVTREIARGNSSGRTALLSSGLFSSVGTLVFIIVGMLLSNSTNLDLKTIILAGSIVPLQFSHTILSHIATGWKPQIASYGNLILEFTRIPFVLIFLFVFNMGINGVFLSLTISFLAGTMAMIYLNRNQLHAKFSLTILKIWLSRFWIPSYPTLTSIIYSFDFLIVTLLSSSEIIGFYAAALTIGGFVSYSKLVAVGVYPKLLGKDRGKYLNENFRLWIYFALLFSTISIAFAKAGLFVLNPAYEIVSIGVIFITIRYFLFSIYDNFNSMLRATETIDEIQNPTIKDFLKSKLFKLPTIQLFQYCGYISILAISLIFIKFSSTVDLILFWSVLSLIMQIPSTLIISIWVKKENLIQIKFLTVSKYFVSLIPTYFLIDFLNNSFLNYNTNFFEFVPMLLLILVVGILTYIGITLILDSNTRFLLKSIISELKHT
jgi:hypothetical protein